MDKIGTIYITPDGTVYQLDDYVPQWLVDQGAHSVSYGVMFNRTGDRWGFSKTSELPADAVKVWEPAALGEVH